MKFISTLLVILLLGGCSSKSYEAYVNSHLKLFQLLELQARQDEAQRRYEQQEHEKKMTKLTGELVMGASRTVSTTDDMMVPLIIMIMEDKWDSKRAVTSSTSKPTLQPVQPPETTGQMISGITPLILGGLGLGLGYMQPNNMKDVALAGITGAGVYVEGTGHEVVTDSYKNGTDNTLSESDGNNIGITQPEETVVRYCGDTLWDDLGNCSCNSYLIGSCTPESL